MNSIEKKEKKKKRISYACSLFIKQSVSENDFNIFKKTLVLN